MVAVRPAVWKRSLENSDTLSMKLHSTGLNPCSPPSSSSDIRGPSHFLKPVLWGKLGSPPFIFLSLLLIPKTLHSFCFPVSAFCSILSGAFRRVYFFFSCSLYQSFIVLTPAPAPIHQEWLPFSFSASYLKALFPARTYLWVLPAICAAAGDSGNAER